MAGGDASPHGRPSATVRRGWRRSPAGPDVVDLEESRAGAGRAVVHPPCCNRTSPTTVRATALRPEEIVDRQRDVRERLRADPVTGAIRQRVPIPVPDRFAKDEDALTR